MSDPCKLNNAMGDWLFPLREALSQATQPVQVFFRDDDAGWCDERLYSLLDLFARHKIGIDLAVIPRTVNRDLANSLCRRIDSLDGLLGLHQHGSSHENHETNGRKYEFGPARSPAEQARDLELGQQRLEDLFGPQRLDPIFTPPWNRCTEITLDCLAALGFRVLSRDKGATAIPLHALLELPVTVDWFKRRMGVRVSQQVLGQLIAESTKVDRLVGIMLHHAVMDEQELRRLEELLIALEENENVQCRLMREVLVSCPG